MHKHTPTGAQPGKYSPTPWVRASYVPFIHNTCWLLNHLGVGWWGVWKEESTTAWSLSCSWRRLLTSRSNWGWKSLTLIWLVWCNNTEQKLETLEGMHVACCFACQSFKTSFWTIWTHTLDSTYVLGMPLSYCHTTFDLNLCKTDWVILIFRFSTLKSCGLNNYLLQASSEFIQKATSDYFYDASLKSVESWNVFFFTKRHRQNYWTGAKRNIVYCFNCCNDLIPE